MALNQRRLSSVNCLYALGGGRVIDGMFPEPRVLSTACRAELAMYFVSIALSTAEEHCLFQNTMHTSSCYTSYPAVQNKQYLVDVDTSIAQAVSYFDTLGEVNHTQAVVFDIDETALSNLPVSTNASHICIKPAVLHAELQSSLTDLM